MEVKHYSCVACINVNTPLCKLCTQITAPSGNERRPKYYIKREDDFLPDTGINISPGLSNKTGERAITIARYLAAGVPIPVRIVLEYNKLVEKKTDKEERV